MFLTVLYARTPSYNGTPRFKKSEMRGICRFEGGTVASALMSVGGWCYMSAMELVSRLTGLDRNRNEIVHDTRTILPNIR